MRALRRVVVRHLAVAALLSLAAAAQAATITIVNLDGPNEGFNDPTPAAPIGGNPMTTIGAQRLFVFQHAANIWGAILPSAVEIRINARFDPQTCDAGGAVLGSAGAGSSHRNFAGAPFPNTWYQQSLANRLAGVDLNPTVSDVNITFNSNLCNPGCVFCWYYGIDGNEGPLVELLPVVFHEIGHGLGFATITLAGVQMGTPPGPHVYDRFLYDLDQDMHWHQMATDAQRGASAVNCQRLVWDGLCVTTEVPTTLGPRPILRVHSPPTVAGDVDAGMAQFGPQTFHVSGQLALANDGTAPPNSPSNGCEPLINVAEIAGRIAVLDRGTCSRAIKVRNAQNAGAIAAIVVDTLPGCPAQGMSGYDPAITIPSVQITMEDGNPLKAQIAAGVNVTLTFDASLTAGAREGKALVYTPNVFATGSSVSHWDVSLQPNQLMEPFITTQVSSDPGLAVEQLTDLGWFGTPAPCGPTATLLAFFQALGRDDGVTLRWRFGEPEDVASVVVERSDVAGADWRALAARIEREGEDMTAFDASAEPGRDHLYRLRVTDRSGETRTLGLVSGRRLAAAAAAELAAPFPNPAAPGTTIRFRLHRPEFVRLAVVDVNGRVVRTLREGMMAAGDHQESWDGTAGAGVGAAPGVYLVTLRTSEGTRTQRVTLSR